jgi:hypothetical protein
MPLGFEPFGLAIPGYQSSLFLLPRIRQSYLSAFGTHPSGFFVVCHFAPLTHIFDQCADVYHAPRGSSRAKFDRLGKAAIFDALPPGRFIYWNNSRYWRFSFWIADDVVKA